MKRIRKQFRKIYLFFSFWRSPDFFGDPIDIKTAWEVANILA